MDVGMGVDVVRDVQDLHRRSAVDGDQQYLERHRRGTYDYFGRTFDFAVKPA